MAEDKELDPITSLPKKEEKSDPLRLLKELNKKEASGEISTPKYYGTSFSGAVSPTFQDFTPLYKKYDLRGQVEGGEYEDAVEGSYYQMLKPGEEPTTEILRNQSKMFQLGYNNSLKRYKNDLAENQGWYNKIANTWGKYLGKTALNVGGGLLGVGYGVVKGLLTMDSEPLFDNGVFSAVDAGTDWLDRRLIVHGDTKYDELRNKRGAFGGSFTPRFMHDPLKVIGDDLTDAASFVSGAILTECWIISRTNRRCYSCC
jgi:hypothetical protein